MSRKCHNNGKLPVFEYLRSMNPSYCVTEVRMLKNANLLFPLIRVTLKSSIRKTPHFPGRQGQINHSVRKIGHFPGHQWQICLSIREIGYFYGREQHKAGLVTIPGCDPRSGR